MIRVAVEKTSGEVRISQDVTESMAEIAEKRRAAREKRSAAVRQIEGDQTYETQQAFLAMTSRLATEGRLSRLVYVSERSR